ncbi:MAG: hypothetical protein Kow0047_33900 [Anaerolineae bacterium]
MAKSLNINVMGVLGILLRARREGTLASLKAIIGELRDKAGFRIGDDLYEQLLREAGEEAST